MDEINTQAEDSTLGQNSPTESESNSTATRNYTEEQHRKGIEDAIAQYGDKVKREKIDPIATERDTFKAQVEQLKSDAEDATTSREDSEKRISELETDLETATESEPDLKEIQRIKKELRTERETVRQERRTERQTNAELKKTLDAERLEWAGTVAEARASKFEVDVFEISEEYVDAAGQPIKSERLKALCEKAGQTKKSDIQELADTLWVKKDKAPVLVGDSGVTSGGGSGMPTTKEGLVRWIESHTQAEYEEKAPLINKMMREGKIK